jgi:type VI secretion system secreted protein Hcp
MLLAGEASAAAPAGPAGGGGPTDCFIKIDGVAGESTDRNHPGEIEIISWAWGETFAGMAFGGGGGGGKVTLEDLVFTAHYSKASIPLMTAGATGMHMPRAILSCRKGPAAPRPDFLTVTLKDVLVAGYRTTMGDVDLTATDEIKLTFGSIEFEYREMKADGTVGASVKGGYDAKANRKM